MKKFTIVLLLIVLPLLVVSKNIEIPDVLNRQVVGSNPLDSVQFKIYKAFVTDMMAQEYEEMGKLNQQLMLLAKEKSNNLISYWQAYLQFYQGIFHLQMNQPENAKDEIEKGIEIISDIHNKTVEDYALLSRLQSIYLQFAGMKIMNLSKEMNDNGRKALELDSENLRANFVHGCNDFYTPEMYGGGKEAEKYFLKAIALPDQKIANKYMPSWGKDEAYELLIKLYLKHGDKEKAGQYYDEAILLYPQNFMIKQLEKSVY